MTISEKIQQYRKKAGLSQEELAKTLLVSRQTISLWENGQTLPTIDNLIRLRDIFGVSLDEMICTEESAHRNESEEFDEEYETVKSPEELALIRRALILPYSIILVLLSILTCATVAYVSLKGASTIAFSLISLVITSCELTALVLTAVKMYKVLRSSRGDLSVTLKINDDVIVLDSRTNEGLVSVSRHQHTDVAVGEVGRDFIRAFSDSRVAYINKSSLSDSTRLNVTPGRDMSRCAVIIALIITLLLTSIFTVDLILGKPLTRVERYSGVKIPEYVGISENERIGLINEIYVEYYAELFLGTGVSDELESSLAESEVWQATDGALDRSIIPNGYPHLGAEYFVHQEYKMNHHVIILYFADENMMSILLTKET